LEKQERKIKDILSLLESEKPNEAITKSGKEEILTRNLLFPSFCSMFKNLIARKMKFSFENFFNNFFFGGIFS